PLPLLEAAPRPSEPAPRAAGTGTPPALPLLGRRAGSHGSPGVRPRRRSRRRRPHPGGGPQLSSLRVLGGRGRAVEAAETDLVHGHAEAAGAVHLEEGAAAGDDGEHAGHLEVHDAIADLDGLVAHGGGACRWRLAIASDVASLGAGPHNAAMLL